MPFDTGLVAFELVGIADMRTSAGTGAKTRLRMLAIERARHHRRADARFVRLDQGSRDYLHSGSVARVSMFSA